MNQKGFHKIIIKNTGLFGVSQLIKIIARIVTNKVAAIFIGPVGIGIIGLLDNIILFIKGFTNFGIPQSSVREVALISEGISKNKQDEGRLLKVIYNWAIVTGILGAIVVLIFSNYINNEVFNGANFNVWVLGLSFYFIFSSISSIRLSVLQAKKKVKTIVKFHLVSAVTISALSTILYYNFGKDGIIPVVIGASFIQLLYSLYLTKEYSVKLKRIPIKEVFYEGLPMAKIGVLLSVSVIFGQACFYIIRWFLKENYSFETLGIYQVGNTFLVGYLGLVFSAMSSDFYPRLCNYEKDKKNFNTLINHQTESALHIVVPAVLALYALAPYLIKILYTKEFLEVLIILKIGLVAIILKAIVWPIGYISLVKGNKSLYLKQNILGDSINVLASLLFFYLYGYLGLGIAMVVMFLISGLYSYYTVKKYYDFKYSKETLKSILLSLFIGVTAVVLIFNTGFVSLNYPFYLLTVLSAFYSLKKIKKNIF